MVKSIQVNPSVPPAKAEKNEHLKNLAGTLASLTAVAGTAVGAQTLVNATKDATSKTSKVLGTLTDNRVVNVVKSTKDFVVKNAKALADTKIGKKAVDIATPILNTVNDKISKGIVYAGEINPKVRVAAAVAAGLVVASHLIDKGQIKAYFNGYNTANDNWNKAIEKTNELAEKAMEKIGYQKKEQ